MTQPRQQIVVTIAPDGTISAATQGIKGTDCLDYIQVLEDLLEATTASSAFTDEYHETTTSTHHEVSNDLHQR